MTTALDLLLVAGLILLALHIATVRDERNAIVAFVSFGLLVALAWLRLASVDVALTEAAIGGGVVGLLLLRAEAQLRTSARPSRRQRLGVRALAVVPCAMVAAGLAFVVVHPPVPAPTLAPAAAASLASLGVGNPVTAVLLAYRALDTLLEKVVLVVALLAVWSLARDDAWKGAPSLRPAQVPDPLAFLARVLPPFGLVVAIYLVWVGADAPGGAFQGGTAMAAMWVLAMLAGPARPPDTGSLRLRAMLVGGPVVFLAVGFAGSVFANAFLAYPDSIAKPLIVAIEVALTLSIAAILGMIVAGAPERAPRS